MIGKVLRGWEADRLVAYLMSPGESNEHTNPTVIAAWQDDPEDLQPRLTGPGQFDFDSEDLSRLRSHLMEPARAGGIPTRKPEEGEVGWTKAGPVWHASISIPAGDGQLSHETWSAIAKDVMNATGIAADGDAGGCRWLAVHHGQSVEGNDHIHLAAMLVRQDTGRRFHPKNDFPKLRSVMRKWEDKLGLTVTAQGDVAAAKDATRAEMEKTDRRRATGMPAAERTDPEATVRDQLRQAVADTAAVSGDKNSFLEGLRDRGLLVYLRYEDGTVDKGRIEQFGRAEDVSGYAVGLPGDVDKDGAPIYYGAAKNLSKDLSWKRLSKEWDRHGGAVADRPDRVTIDLTAGIFNRARAEVERARTSLDTAGAREGQDIAVAAHRMIATYSRVTDGTVPDDDAPRTRAVWSSHRSAASARMNGAGDLPAAPLADALNAASRDLMMLRWVTEKGSAATASAELMVALSMLMIEVAAWHERRGDLPAAQAARSAGDQLGTARPAQQPNSVPAVAAATRQARAVDHSTTSPAPQLPNPTTSPHNPRTPQHRPKGPRQ